MSTAEQRRGYKSAAVWGRRVRVWPPLGAERMCKWVRREEARTCEYWEEQNRHLPLCLVCSLLPGTENATFLRCDPKGWAAAVGSVFSSIFNTSALSLLTSLLLPSWYLPFFLHCLRCHPCAHWDPVWMILSLPPSSNLFLLLICRWNQQFKLTLTGFLHFCLIILMLSLASKQTPSTIFAFYLPRLPLDCAMSLFK